MKLKLILVAALVVLILGGIALYHSYSPRSGEDCGSCAGELSAATETDNAMAEIPPDTTATIIAYYFHTTQRCANCYKIENYTHEAIENEFSGEIKKGRLIWRMVNTDQPENEHFIKDYKLFTKSVVLTDVRDGKQMRWKNLDKVWSLLSNKDAFQEYIRGEVRAYLGA